MAKLNVLRKSTVEDKLNKAFRTTLEILSSEDITKYVFVNQRIRDYIKNNFEDVFAAVSSPTQLEDLDIGSPSAETSYYRTHCIDIVTYSMNYMNEIVDSILIELQKLLRDFEALNRLKPEALYELTAENMSEITISTLATEYRIPLFAQPCGGNEIFNEGGLDKQRVSSQNTNLPGWLNRENTDPVGYNFKYNINKDLTLKNLWPPNPERISASFLDVNGEAATSEDVLINANGIYWKSNQLGFSPFPADYVDENDQGSELNKVILVLDFYK